MIRRVFLYFSAEARGMHVAAYILALSALLSSLLAFVRDRLLAHTFGAGSELDLYYAAFRIPDLLFVVIGSLVSVYVIIPRLAERSDDEKRAYLDTIMVGFSIIAIVLAGLAALCAPAILSFLFPALAQEGLSTLTTLTRILLLQPLFLGISNVLAAVTQYYNRFTLYAATPILYNLGIIFGVSVLYPLFGMEGIVWGVVLGAFLHAAVQIPSVLASGFFTRIPSTWSSAQFYETVVVSLPRALTLSVGQISFLALLSLASGLTAGSISVFMFSFNLHAVPLAIIGASYSAAAFPTLARLSRGNPSAFVEQVSTAFRHIIFWSLPAIALIVVLRAHLVRIVLGSGAFDWTDTRLTAAALALFSVSIAAQGVTLLMVRAYYAIGQTLVPFVVALIVTATTILSGWLLVSFFAWQEAAERLEVALRVRGLEGTEVMALALAFSLGSVVGALMFMTLFNRLYPHFVRSVLRTTIESIIASLSAGVAAYGVLSALGTITLASTLASVIVRGGVAGLVGIGVAALTYFILGNREFRETVDAFSRRLWREARPVASAEESEAAHT